MYTLHTDHSVTAVVLLSCTAVALAVIQDCTAVKCNGPMRGWMSVRSTVLCGLCSLEGDVKAEAAWQRAEIRTDV